MKIPNSPVQLNGEAILAEGREELSDRTGQRTVVGQRLRCRVLDLRDGHLFLDGLFHTAQTDTELILDQFTDGPDPTVAQHIDIIGRSYTIQE